MDKTVHHNKMLMSSVDIIYDVITLGADVHKLVPGNFRSLNWKSQLLKGDFKSKGLRKGSG